MAEHALTILFQGDSITDAGRSREANTPPNAGLGSGYPLFVAGSLLSAEPRRGLRILNRGISGNRVVDLYARWKADALNLAPDVISILIGVNDTWHEFGSRNGVEPARYGQIYRMLLDWTRQTLPNTKLVLCEPFVLMLGAVKEAWLPEIAERRRMTVELAREFGAIHVPFQRLFDEAVQEAPAACWLGDGVHPTVAGHARMAEFWIRTVRAAGLL